ncbi:type IV pilus biogenesis protein PilP [Leptospirillum ferriphilum]|uniref:type IV pilus biogenesis protein PilP n=1 Tax=Leptospirillum ferriphilum TaxID=178606 RepID=UPI0006B209B3|nr:type IV pilus biogenesis protein PilP [Leptospirillum ferriphilum]
MRSSRLFLIVSVLSFSLSVPFAFADPPFESGNSSNSSLDEYVKLKDQEKILEEQQTIRKLKEDLKKKKATGSAAPYPGYPYPGYGLHPGKKVIKYRIYSVKGTGRFLTATIIDNKGNIFYAKKGDHLPGGYLVKRLSGEGVVLRRGRKNYPIGFRVSGARSAVAPPFVPPSPVPMNGQE